MGENIFGLGVGVGCGAAASIGKVFVGAALDGATSGAGVEASAAQAVIKTQPIKISLKIRFIKMKYIGQKLSRDEFLC